MNQDLKTALQKPAIGSGLTVAAGLSFFFTCMLLPLVGPAGSSVPYALQNKLAFLGVLLITFVLGGLATWSKLMRRKVDQSPFPVWSAALCAVCIVLFALLVTGLLAI